MWEFGHVSRETSERLKTYRDLLTRWNAKINLVAPSSLANLETRHFKDSWQLLDIAPPHFEDWVDLGSGGGFPGLIIAILCAEYRPKCSFKLIESDRRKCAFLRSVSRETGVSVEIIDERIEDIPPLHAEVISARALAPLSKLLEYSERHLAPEGTAIFLKGEQWQEELRGAQSRWKFKCDAFNSSTSTQARILRVKEVSRV